jgi:hypothetical protein
MESFLRKQESIDAFHLSLNAAIWIAGAPRGTLCPMKGIMGSRLRGTDR